MKTNVHICPYCHQYVIRPYDEAIPCSKCNELGLKYKIISSPCIYPLIGPKGIKDKDIDAKDKIEVLIIKDISYMYDLYSNKRELKRLIMNDCIQNHPAFMAEYESRISEHISAVIKAIPKCKPSIPIS